MMNIFKKFKLFLIRRNTTKIESNAYSYFLEELLNQAKQNPQKSVSVIIDEIVNRSIYAIDKTQFDLKVIMIGFELERVICKDTGEQDED